MSSTRAACTIVSPNYLPFARTLAQSYLAHHPGQRFFVLIVASLTDPAPFAGEPFEPVLLTHLWQQAGSSPLPHEAMKYDILELNTNVKPTFLRYLIAQHGLERLVYLDPDIACYAPLTPVFDALETNDAVLTPHITQPITDDKNPSEQDLLFNGTYNLGFIAVRNTPQSLALLAWWERRCLDLGFSEGRTGLFVDQKWINLAPGLFEHVAILRHPGCNMAYWNLHERTLTAANPASPLVNGQPLCFFHFSGIVPSDPANLSKHTDRFTLATRPDLQPLFAAYKASVLVNARPAADSLPYGFDRFSDGTALTRLARRIYAQHVLTVPSIRQQADPFDAAGPFLRFARAQKLVAGAEPPPKATWSDAGKADRKIALVHRLLAYALRALGPNRYELLMRYLAHIAILRNQSVFINRGLDTPPR